MSSPAVWVPWLLLFGLIGVILNVVRPMAVVAYRRFVRAGYERRLSAWSALRDDLEELVDIAKTAQPLSGDGAVQLASAGFSYSLKRDEVVYRIFPGAMVEERSRQNVPTVVQLFNGSVAITNFRLLFEGGGKRREWAYDKLTEQRSVGSDTTLYGVTSRKAMSGIKYGDGNRTRVYLALAINEFRGTRDRVVAATESQVAQHQTKRPVEPPPVESRSFSGRDLGMILCSAALIVWPVVPALTRASHPTVQPSWGWLIAALVPALVGVTLWTRGTDANPKHSLADSDTKPKPSFARRGAIAGATVTALVIGGGFAVPASALEGTVRRVVDGDTIVVRVHGSDLNVRILNIDTPETVNPQVPDECLGQEASTYTEQLLPPGTRVDLKFDKERTDRYGRTLAAVTLSNGKSVANELARAGLGIPMVVGSNDSYFDPVLAAFKNAEANKRGYFDPSIDCTFPAQQAQLQEDLAAAKAADAGITAAEAAVTAATVLALYEAHRATSLLISAGTGFAIRAMKAVGSTAGFAAYQATTRSLGHVYDKLRSVADEREQVEREAREKREAAARAAAEAAAAAAQRAEDERNRRESDQWSSGGDDDFNVPGWACPTRWC